MSKFYNKNNFYYKIGIFLERPNRFIAYIQHNGEIRKCHVPDPGRLKELLIKGRRVLLRIPKNSNSYKTFAAGIGVEINTNYWVSIDSQLAGRMIKHEWKNLPVFKNYEVIKPEFTLKSGSRLDFLLTHAKEPSCLVEVKTVTLNFPENSGIGLFPDAPTKRGTKHLKELIEAYKNGYRAIILFVAPRNDINEIRPNYSTDPIFSRTLEFASREGVELLAFRCDFNQNGIQFKKIIPVNI